MNRAVLDTNVLLRALLRPNGPSGHLWDRRAEFIPCSSPETLAEIIGVCAREGLRAKAPHLTDRAVEKLVAMLRRGAHAELPPNIVACRDPNDDKFLACTLATEASCIVTEDKDLLEMDGYEGLRIVTPAEFVHVLERERPTGRRNSPSS